MGNEYAEAMQRFFNSREYREYDYSSRKDPKQLALAFANHFRTATRPQNTAHDYQGIHLPKNQDIRNVSIIAKDTSLPFLTKRVPLVANTTVLTHFREEQHTFFEQVDNDRPRPGSPARSTWCYLRCPDLVELGKWLEACKPLLLSGDLFYFPDIYVERLVEYEDDTRNQPVPDEASTLPLCDLIVQNRKIVDTLTTNIVKSRIVIPILQIDLPYIENVSLETFCKITSDERMPIEQFRDFLRLKFLDLRKNEGSDYFETNLAKIGIELREGVRQLDSDFTKIKRQRAFQATTAVVAATTAVLVALNSTALGHLPEVVGPSGGSLLILKALEEYLSKKREVKTSPYYYLWLFSKKSVSP